MPRQRKRSIAPSFEALEARHLLTSGPFISEFLASNQSGLQDRDGDFSDWIEISNPSPSAVDLNGWYLTDDNFDYAKWQFPSVIVPAGGQLIVFASNKDRTDPAFELHTNFSISAGGEYLGLIEPDGTTIASQFSPNFPPQSSDVSYGYEPVSTATLVSGALSTSYVPTDGSLGLTWTQRQFDDTSWTAGSTGVGFSTTNSYGSLIGSNIQDAMLHIGSSAYVRIPFTIEDLSTVDALLLRMQYDDGFIAYLNGMEVARSNAPSFAEWNSVATTSQPDGVPDVEQFDLSGDLSALIQGTNLLAIHGMNDSVNGADFLVLPELVSLKLNTEPPTYLEVPTPGAINLASSVNQVSQTRFSQERGFYDAPFDLVISSNTPGATISYTIDGSSPTTTAGQIYREPIPIDSTTVVRAIAYKTGMQTTQVSTQTFLFLDDVIRQPANIPGYPNNTSSVGNGQSVVNDYEMDPEIVNDPSYSGVIKGGLMSIPTMSIAVDVADMFGAGGFYSGEAEKPASIEIFDASSPGSGLQVNGGIEPHSHNRLKRSLRLSFKSEYGPTKLVSDLLRNAPLHGDTASNRLDNLVLRAGNNRAWSRAWNPDATTFTEDQWYRDTQIAMEGFGSHGTFVQLYINGIYWGLYNPVERPDEGFSAEYFGGSDDDWFSTNHDGRTSGDRTRWDYLRGPLILSDMSVATNYEELRQYLDVTNFSDYLLLNWYQTTTDWPNNNWYVGYRTDIAGPARYYSWDGEWSWDVARGAPGDGAWVHPAFRNGSTDTNDAAQIWRSLKNNSDFMMHFADRAYHHLFNDGALTDANVLARWNILNDYVRDAVVAESARWGDALESLGQPTRTRDVDWQNEVNLIAGLMNGNAARLIAAMRAEGYYPSIDAPTYNHAGGLVPPGLTLQITAPVGASAVYYTIDGSDPRLPGGELSPTAMLYDPASGVPLTQAGWVRSRAQSDTEWSALNEAYFSLLPDGSNRPPFVNAGTNQSITLPDTALLVGSASDDGLPDNILITTWQKLSGPGTATFGDASQLRTTAAFSAPGTYTLRLTADDGDLASSSDIIITVNSEVGHAVESFTLINADTDLPIPGFDTMGSGVILNLATLPSRSLNVRANTSGSIGSVRFSLNADPNFRTENVVPYALFGDNNGDYGAGTFDVGDYSLTATPYSGSGANGEAGRAMTIEFAVIDEDVLPGDFDRNGIVDTADYDLWASTFGSTTELAADANGNGIVDAADFTIWRDNLGAMLPATNSVSAVAISHSMAKTSAAKTVAQVFASFDTREKEAWTSPWGGWEPMVRPKTRRHDSSFRYEEFPVSSSDIGLGADSKEGGWASRLVVVFSRWGDEH